MKPVQAFEVEGDVSLGLDGQPITRVRAFDNRILIYFSSIRKARTLVALMPRGPGRGALLFQLQSALGIAGLEVEAYVRGHRVASLSGAGRGCWLGKLLGLRGARVSLPGFVRAVLRPGSA